MQDRRTYKGYQLVDLSSVVRAGVYRARVAVIRESDGDTHNQRFLDFETFSSMDAARLRAIDGAVSWIDDQLERDKLFMPSRFA